jgi:hypothetical protein
VCGSALLEKRPVLQGLRGYEGQLGEHAERVSMPATNGVDEGFVTDGDLRTVPQASLTWCRSTCAPRSLSLYPSRQP